MGLFDKLFSRQRAPLTALNQFSFAVQDQIADMLRPFDPKDILVNDPASNKELAIILLVNNGALQSDAEYIVESLLQKIK